jgi:hypothetical protein
MSKSIPDLASTNIEIIGDQVVIHQLKFVNKELADILKERQGNDQKILEFLELIDLAVQVKRTINLDEEVKQMHNTANLVSEKLDKAGKIAFDRLESLIADLGNEYKDTSLIKIMKTKFMETIKNELSVTLDLTDERSPLNKLDIKIKAIIDQLNNATVRKEESKRGTAHGRDFNEVMDGILKSVAFQNGDSAEYVDAIECEAGCKKGDELIKINPATVNNNDVKIVWEFKTEKGFTDTGALKELNDAIKCRQAQAGVFVLARDEKNKHWPEFLNFDGRRAIVVVDEDNIDVLIIRYAYYWSRIEAIRSLGDASKTFDTSKVLVKLEEAKNAIRGFQQVAGAHTGISKSLAEAQDWLNKSRENTQKIFTEIEEIIKNNG